ncbi:MAG: carbon-nitrogen hydrolase family protein [Chloroflexota bacterium]|nr:carbon-nitrogen hydrolase family protein [Chloroflexota bacterium]
MDYPVSGLQHLAIAAIQFNPRDDKIANIDKALALVDQAASSGARIVMLPGVWTYMGDPDRTLENAEPIPGDLTQRLAERARRHGIYLHAGTFTELVEGDERVRNTALVFNPDGEIIATYRKIHMFDISLDGGNTYQESATVAPGDEIVTFDFEGVTIGLATCYDLRFPELFRILALRGAEVILLPAAFTQVTGKDHWEVLIRARAIENQVYMVAANQFGQNLPGRWCYGRSMIVDPWGTVLATAPDVESVITAVVDRNHLASIRRQIPSLANRQPAVYQWPDTMLTGV